VCGDVHRLTQWLCRGWQCAAGCGLVGESVCCRGCVLLGGGCHHHTVATLKGVSHGVCAREGILNGGVQPAWAMRCFKSTLGQGVLTARTQCTLSPSVHKASTRSWRMHSAVNDGVRECLCFYCGRKVRRRRLHQLSVCVWRFAPLWLFGWQVCSCKPKPRVLRSSVPCLH
jgi:hypothetical protein